MKDSLKDFIDNNRAEFDDRTPSQKVWGKIQSNLPGMKSVSLWNSVAMWRAAALIFMALSVTLYITSIERPADKKIAVALQGEFKAIESYYSGEIAKKIALIDHFDGTFEKEQFTQDLEKLDAMYQVLSDELKVRPTEKVRDALILNILVRIDLLNQQIKKLEDKKHERAKSDASV